MKYKIFLLAAFFSLDSAAMKPDVNRNVFVSSRYESEVVENFESLVESYKSINACIKDRELKKIYDFAVTFCHKKAIKWLFCDLEYSEVESVFEISRNTFSFLKFYFESEKLTEAINIFNFSFDDLSQDERNMVEKVLFVFKFSREGQSDKENQDKVQERFLARDEIKNGLLKLFCESFAETNPKIVFYSKNFIASLSALSAIFSCISLFLNETSISKLIISPDGKCEATCFVSSSSAKAIIAYCVSGMCICSCLIQICLLVYEQHYFVNAREFKQNVDIAATAAADYIILRNIKRGIFEPVIGAGAFAAALKEWKKSTQDIPLSRLVIKKIERVK